MTVVGDEIRTKDNKRSREESGIDNIAMASTPTIELNCAAKLPSVETESIESDAPELASKVTVDIDQAELGPIKETFDASKGRSESASDASHEESEIDNTAMASTPTIELNCAAKLSSIESDAPESASEATANKA